MTFPIHTIESAPEASQDRLRKAKQSLGAVPNLYGVLANSPETFAAYQTLSDLFQKTSFSVEEQTVVWQAINVENGCHYCVPAHTAIAHMQKVDVKVTEALRNGTPLPTEKLEVLRATTLELVRQRGHLAIDKRELFFAAGYQPKQLIEIILGLAQKTISNYVNHLADTPVDEMFKAFSWDVTKSVSEARV